MSVPLHHAPYETVYQLGRHFEDFKKDKEKRLLIECKHADEDKVEITSKYNEHQEISEQIHVFVFCTGRIVEKRSPLYGTAMNNTEPPAVIMPTCQHSPK